MPAEECNGAPDVARYKAALQLEGGCILGDDGATCNGPSNANTDNADIQKESVANMTFHMSVDYSAVAGSSGIDLRESVAASLNAAGLKPTKFNAVGVSAAYYGSDERDTVVAVAGDSAEVNSLVELVAAGKFYVSLGNRDSLPPFLRRQAIAGTANARRLQPADLLRVESSAVGLLPAAAVNGVVGWCGDAESCFAARVMAFPHNDHVESADGGSVQATVASLTAKQSVQIVREPSARVVAVHTNTDGWVWPDDPTVTAVLQPTDAVRSHILKPTTLCLRARYLNFASEEVAATCTTDPGSLLCVAKLELPSRWFPRSAAAKPTVDVYAGVCDELHPDISLHKYAAKIAVLTLGPELSGRKQPKGRVVGELPTATFHNGDIIAAPISVASVAEAAASMLKVVQMSFKCDPKALQFESATFADGWEGSMRCAEGNTARSSCTVVATKRSVGGRKKDDGDASKEAPFALQIRVAKDGGSATAAAHWIDGKIVRMYSEDGSVISASSADVYFVGRGSELNVARGNIYVAGVDSLVGLIPRMEQTTLINTAALGGKVTGAAVSVIGVYESGKTENVAGGKVDLKCTSSDTAVFQVNEDCSSVVVDGSETSGGLEKLTVKLAGDGVEDALQAALPVHVFYPVEGSVKIASLGAGSGEEEIVLSAVRGWTRDADGASCVQQRQQRDLVVTAKFSMRTLTSKAPAVFEDDLHVSVTHAVAGALTTSDESIASVTAPRNGYGPVLVSGSKTGKTSLLLRTPHGDVATVSVSVPPEKDKVNVQQLRSSVVVSVKIVSDPISAPASAASAYDVEVVTEKKLDHHGDVATVVVHALYSDGTRGRVAPSGGLKLKGVAGDDAIAAAADAAGAIVVAAGGHGWALAMELESTCNDKVSVAASGVGYVDATTARVVGLAVHAGNAKTSEVRVAHAESQASDAELGIPQNASILVVATYADGETADVSATAVYDDATGDPDDLFSIVRSEGTGQHIVIVNDPEAVGTATLYVSNPTVEGTTDGKSTTIEVTIVVVNAVGLVLTAAPYPLYEGAASNSEAQVLNLIGKSDFYQQVLLSAELELSDGTAIDVSATSRVSFQPVPAGIVQVGSASAGGTRNVLSAFEGANEGEVSVYAAFNGVQTQAPLRVQTVSDRVLPVELFDLEFPALLGAPGGNGVLTFAAEAEASISPLFGAAFNDGTRYAARDMTSEADGNVYPGVAKFELAKGIAGGVVEVDQVTGEVTLLANHHRPVVVRAGVAGSSNSYSEEVSFAANLDPSTGDVDLGATLGFALPSQPVGSTLTVPLRINVGNADQLSAFHIRLSVSPIGILDFLDSSPSVGWPGGMVRTVKGSAEGSIEIGGLCTAANATGIIDVLDLQFQALSAGEFTISGDVVMIAGAGARVVASGSPIVAGAVLGEIVQKRLGRRGSVASRAQRAVPPQQQQQQQQQPRPRSVRYSPLPARSAHARRAATGCSEHPAGDANGDCTVDIRDASYLYNAAHFASGEEGACPDSRGEDCDPDKNGVVDAADALYQLNYILGLYPLVRDLAAIPASERSSCLLTMSVNVYIYDPKKQKSVLAPADKVSVFFDLEVPEADAKAAADQLADTSLGQSLIAVPAGTKSDGFAGVVWKASKSPKGPFMLRAESGLKLDGVGVSVVVATHDYRGLPARERIAPLFAGSPDPPYSYTSPLKLSLPVGRGVVGEILRPRGYSPWLTFDHPITSLQCQSGVTVFPTSSTTKTTETTTRTETETSATATTVTVTTISSTSSTETTQEDGITVETSDAADAAVGGGGGVGGTDTNGADSSAASGGQPAEDTPNTGIVAGASVGGLFLVILIIFCCCKNRNKTVTSIVPDAKAFETAQSLMQESSFVENHLTPAEPAVAPYIPGAPIEAVGDTAASAAADNLNGGYLDVTDGTGAAPPPSDSEPEPSDESDGEEAHLGFFFGKTEHAAHSYNVLQESAATKEVQGCTLGASCSCVNCKAARADARQAASVHTQRRRKSLEIAAIVSELSGVSSPDPGYPDTVEDSKASKGKKKEKEEEEAKASKLAAIRKMQSEGDDLFANLEQSLMSGGASFLSPGDSASSLAPAGRRASAASVQHGGGVEDWGLGNLIMEIGGGGVGTGVMTAGSSAAPAQCTYLGTCTCPDCSGSF